MAAAIVWRLFGSGTDRHPANETANGSAAAGFGTRSEAHRASGPPTSVSVATIGTGDIRITLSGLGAVTPLDTVTVKTRIDGQLVRKGQFLAQFDPGPYLVALEQAQGTLAHDQGLLG